MSNSKTDSKVSVLKNIKNGRNHIPTEDGEAKCGYTPSQKQLLELKNPKKFCELCIQARDGNLEEKGPEIYENSFNENQIENAQEFIENMDKSFKSKLISDYNFSFVVNFSIYHSNDISAFEVKKKTGANIQKLMEADSTYQQLFCW